MDRKSLPIAAALTLAALLPVHGARAAAPAEAVAWSACTLEGVEGRAECAAVAVPESRSGKSRRTIALRVARLLPLEGPAAADPVFVLQGGPGQSAVSLAEFYGGESWRATRRTRAIVLVDQRGTGGSNPLNCDLGGSSERPEAYFHEMFPEAPLKACREQLRARADLAQYTTDAAVQDLEEVRARLGHARISLYGTSYGTRVAMRYLDLHPDRVRAVVLKGVVEPDGVIPASFARDTEASLQHLFADCEADAACRTAYPALREDYRRMRAALAKGPVRTTVEGPDRARREVALTDGMVAASIRSLLQATPVQARLPQLISAAGQGDFAPMAGLILQLRKAGGAVSTGLTLSVACAEDAPYLRPADEGATLLRDYWRVRLLAACRVWDVPRDPAAFRRPARHRTPALLISGVLDPATPPSGAEAVRRRLPNSAHLVAANGSHSFAGMAGCADLRIAEFLQTADPKRLDLSCGAAIRRPPFAVPKAGD